MNDKGFSNLNFPATWCVSLKKSVQKRIPIFRWLPRYKKSDLVADLIAGTTVGMTVVPQSIAYAAIAGLSPEYGLYSSYIGCFLYAILGSCKQVTTGPTAVMGLLTYEICGNDVASCAVLTAFYTGIFQLIMALLQLGWVVNFISEAVTIGFTAGAATTIISSQVKNLFGIDGAKGSGFLGYWKAIFRDVSTFHIGDSVLGCTSFVVLLLLRKLKDCPTSQSRRGKIFKVVLWLLAVSRNVTIIIVTTLIAFSITNPPFKLTGYVQSGFPNIELPHFELETNSTEGYYKRTFWETWSFLGAGPLVIALISILQNVAISKAFGSDKTDGNQELAVLSLSNIVGGFFNSMPISGSFSRSAVNEASGVRSPLGGLFTGTLVLMSLGLLTPSFSYIPKASLASVIISASMFLIEFQALLPMWRVCKLDLVICLVTFFCSIFLGMEYGIFTGVCISIIILLFRSIRPHLATEVLSDDVTGLQYTLVRLGYPLTFPSADSVQSSINEINLKSPHIRIIVIDFKNCTTCDYTVVKTLASLVHKMDKMGNQLIFINCNLKWENAFSSVGVVNPPCCTNDDLSVLLQSRWVICENASITKTSIKETYVYEPVENREKVETLLIKLNVKK